MRLSSTFKQLFNVCLVILVGGFLLLHHSTQGVMENDEAAKKGVEIGAEKGLEDSLKRVENGVENNMEDGENSTRNGSDYQRILLSKLVHLRESCGELCDLDRPLHPPQGGAIMATTRAKVDCATIFSLDALAPKVATGEDPISIRELPEGVLAMFSHGGKVDTWFPWYMNDAPVVEDRRAVVEYNHQHINQLVDAWRQRKHQDDYLGASEAIDRAAEQVGVQNKTILIIGTQVPWLEAVLLARDPHHLYTLEYGNFYSGHPKLTFIRPLIFKQKFLDGSLPLFDLVFSFSSLEHSGLGRYGDPLNPFGDMITVAQAHCVSRPQALLVLGVPTSLALVAGTLDQGADREAKIRAKIQAKIRAKMQAVQAGPDELVFNAHRIYGPRLYPFLTTNWRQVWPGREEVVRELPSTEGWTHSDLWRYQPVIVFQKQTQNMED